MENDDLLSLETYPVNILCMAEQQSRECDITTSKDFKKNFLQVDSLSIYD